MARAMKRRAMAVRAASFRAELEARMRLALDTEMLPEITGSAAVFVRGFLERFLEEIDTGDSEALDTWLRQLASIAPIADYNLLLERFIALTIAAGTSSQDAAALERLLMERRESWRKLLLQKGEVVATSGTMMDVAEGFLAIMDMHDPKTARHCRAVGVVAGRIAGALGLGQQENLYRAAGYVHDIGHLFTRQEIFEATTPLGLAEMHLIRAHTVRSANILEHTPALAPLASMVRGHHERHDGEGYPDNLAGAEIPFGARVLAVADAFHAMI